VGWGPGDIILVRNGRQTVWATAGQLNGVSATADIDALAIRDRGNVGALDPSDLVWLSLAGSPTVFQAYPTFSTIFTGADFNLLPTDDLNALMAIDPVDPPPGDEPKPNSERIKATAQLLMSPIEFEATNAPLDRILTDLERKTKTKCTLGKGEKAPDVSVCAAGGNVTLGRVLHDTLDPIGWTFEIGYEGELIFRPRAKCIGPQKMGGKPSP